MGSIVNLIHAFGLDGVVRARALQMLRMAGAAAAGWLGFWLTKHGIAQADASAIGAAVAALILASGSAVFSWIDPAAVDQKMADAHAQGAALAASAIRAGKATPEQITALSGSPEALKQLLAMLKAGQE